MKRRDLFRSLWIAAAVALVLGGALVGCDTGFENPPMGNEAPQTWVASGPPDSSNSEFRVHLYWGGFDPDGAVSYFEYVITDNGPGGFDPADTTGRDKWTRIEIGDTVFTVKADLPEDPGNQNNRNFFRSHTFFVRAVDEHGQEDPSPAYRSFTALTLAPEVDILTPVNPRPGDIHALPNNVTFTWEATDEGGTLPADSVRWAVFKAGTDNAQALERLVDTLFKRVEDPLWSPWIYYSAPDDSGKKRLVQTIEFPPTQYYAFVVQAKDLAGAITPTYDERRNVRKIQSKTASGPVLFVTEKLIGTAQFLGSLGNPTILNVPSGLELEFSWEGDASGSGLSITGYRYGWDVVDPSDPDQWDTAFDPNLKQAPPITWNFGQHLLLVEARDSGGGSTLGRIQVNVIPFPMDRPVLWVDDARDALQCSTLQKRPLAFCDQEHDDEWLPILGHVEGFDPERDVYDVKSSGYRVPPVEMMAHYQNVIWNTGGAEIAPGTLPDALASVIKFVPSCQTTGKVEINSLSVFLGKGGHIWVSGWNPLSMAEPGGQTGAEGRFPSVMKLDFARTCATGGRTDTSGVRSFPARDVCLVAVDRSTGTVNQFREGVDGRNARDDGLYEAGAINPAFPPLDSLTVPSGERIPIGIPTMTARDVWVAPGAGYIDPLTGERIGFDRTDIYDSQYWLKRDEIPSDIPLHRDCFIPLWQHRTKGSSILMANVEVNGGWSTVHAWRQADLPGGRKGVMAMSLYMGFEPYFFAYDEFERVANYVLFKEWKLQYVP
jgi:hypothetical protein